MRKTTLIALGVTIAACAGPATAGEVIVPARFKSKAQRKRLLTKSVKRTPKAVLALIKKGPKPGAYLDGDDRLVLVGTATQVKLLRGAAHIETFPGSGTVTVPAGVRMRARVKGACRWTKLAKVEGEGRVTLSSDQRRVFYFDGRHARDGATLSMTGSGQVFVRGFEAAVELEMSEWKGRVREYCFPRTPTYLARKKARRRDRRDTLRRLGALGVRLFTLGGLL